MGLIQDPDFFPWTLPNLCMACIGVAVLAGLALGVF